MSDALQRTGVSKDNHMSECMKFYNLITFDAVSRWNILKELNPTLSICKYKQLYIIKALSENLLTLFLQVILVHFLREFRAFV